MAQCKKPVRARVHPLLGSISAISPCAVALRSMRWAVFRGISFSGSNYDPWIWNVIPSCKSKYSYISGGAWLHGVAAAADSVCWG